MQSGSPNGPMNGSRISTSVRSDSEVGEATAGSQKRTTCRLRLGRSHALQGTTPTTRRGRCVELRAEAMFSATVAVRTSMRRDRGAHVATRDRSVAPKKASAAAIPAWQDRGGFR